MGAVDAVNDWRADAACARIDPELFFPVVGGNPTQAIAICRRCPVRTECLEDALAYEALPEASPHGVWGGVTARERQAILGQRRALPCPSCGTPTPKSEQGKAVLCGLCREARRTESQRRYNERRRAA